MAATFELPLDGEPTHVLIPTISTIGPLRSFMRGPEEKVFFFTLGGLGKASGWTDQAEAETVREQLLTAIEEFYGAR